MSVFVGLCTCSVPYLHVDGGTQFPRQIGQKNGTAVPSFLKPFRPTSTVVDVDKSRSLEEDTKQTLHKHGIIISIFINFKNNNLSNFRNFVTDLLTDHRKFKTLLVDTETLKEYNLSLVGTYIKRKIFFFL